MLCTISIGGTSIHSSITHGGWHSALTHSLSSRFGFSSRSVVAIKNSKEISHFCCYFCFVDCTGGKDDRYRYICTYLILVGMAAKAVWNGAVLASTDDYEVVEGNIYFPPASLNLSYFKPSSTVTTCGWKGQAS
ncbi:hypothetical protein O6H91_18G014300 [Diphasiastrum complanatum]|uniref:Uncharacterized protein n=2 Tax=Diphasiastrum complanatum TaxID=34168 RepID=A0ACC2AYL1_DIPCM|nr:hypothetical protein O6H91_18G014100 [Diphasiastrum complanatum]KAJ7522497.1 hypothetical protein O6H91_18G014300 [Diphasiastrum complanatum]